MCKFNFYFSSEKKILVGSDDTGKDLMGVQKLKKKHKRIEAEIGSHEPNVDRILVWYLYFDLVRSVLVFVSWPVA